jgi:Mce-associated membrane protein
VAQDSATQRARRRASRAAGPANGESTATTTVRVQAPAASSKQRTAPLGPPPRRPAHRRLVVNMFSYTPDTIDQSVNRFVDGTSGPLRGMLDSNNNVENLKILFRDTKASSEAVVNGAALESVDNVTDNASVLVSVRVTVTDIDGVNKPSMPYRMRVIVHEDDNGRMTGYDLKYPEGGN